MGGGGGFMVRKQDVIFNSRCRWILTFGGTASSWGGSSSPFLLQVPGRKGGAPLHLHPRLFIHFPLSHQNLHCILVNHIRLVSAPQQRTGVHPADTGGSSNTFLSPDSVQLLVLCRTWTFSSSDEASGFVFHVSLWSSCDVWGEAAEVKAAEETDIRKRHAAAFWGWRWGAADSVTAAWRNI